MRKAHISLAPEGLPLIGLLTVATLAFAALHWAIPAMVALIFLCFTAHFFRDPERVIPHAPGLAVSPADGRIIRIAEREDPFSGDMRVCVSIFMNLFSVHVNRSPVAGVVCDTRYVAGKFFNASFDKASTDNERCAWQVRDEDGQTWSFVQIAGLVARRIVPHAEVGDTLTRGQRMGMIRFGSRVDLYLPQGYDACVSIGDETLAGHTVIARKASAVAVSAHDGAA